jgi:hypothetical protein
MRAGRQDVRDYWDALRRALEALEGEAVNLAAQAGLLLAPPGKRKARLRAPGWIILWLVREFVQHLVAHSLYLGEIVKEAK